MIYQYLLLDNTLRRLGELSQIKENSETKTSAIKQARKELNRIIQEIKDIEGPYYYSPNDARLYCLRKLGKLGDKNI